MLPLAVPPQWLSVSAIFLLPILIMFLFGGKSRQKSGKRVPPGPPKLPIIGNLHQLGSVPHKSLWKMSEKYGPVIQVQLGRINYMIVNTMETSRQVLKDFDRECCSRAPAAVPGKISYDYKDVVFAPYSEYWKEMRKLVILELLSMKRVQMFWYARNEQVDKLNELLANSYPSPVNITKQVFESTDSFIGTVAFGKTYGKLSFRHELGEVVRGAMDMMNAFHAEDFFPSGGKYVDMLTGSRAWRDKIFRDLDGYFEKLLDQHLDPSRPKPEHEDFVDILLGLMENPKTSFKLTRDHLKAILMDIYIGAIDTSTVTITWAFSELLKNQIVMKKAQAEIRRIVGPNKKRVEPDDLDKLTYLDYVIRETFRKDPPMPLLVPHLVMKPVNIGGYDVEPGTRIMINIYSLGREPNRWDSPELFYPERFENAENTDVDYRGSHYELVPFGSGRRQCPGTTMGSSAVKHTLANLLYGFDYSLPNGLKFEDFPMEERVTLAVHNKHDIVVIAKQHEWTE